jgi:hypothetical protein
MRTLIPLAIAALLTVAPALAQDAEPACPEGQAETPEGCSKQAWVDAEDCPPEHMCAAGEPSQYGEDGCIECSGPTGSDPVPYGPEDCIDCTSAPPQDPATCMDGAQDGESCLDDVQYLGGPGQAPASDADAEASGKDAPALTAVLLMAALGALVLALRRK